jgi:hypothetical protein
VSGNWPDGWITATLRVAGLPISDFTRKALQAWSDSTPILPYTNNPLGMPAVKGRTLELMRTGYAMFVTMGDFRVAFADFVSSEAGRAVHDALALGEKYSELWRAISVLKWPASTTETDWPSAILDLTSESYRAKVQSVDSEADRKTSGVIGTQTAFGDGTASSSRNAASTVNALQQAQTASQYNMRRLG